MGILTWIILGLVAGLIANFIMKSGFGIVGDIIVGILGALIGGFLASLLFHIDVTGFNPTSIIIAILGAIILIGALRMFGRGRTVAR